MRPPLLPLRSRQPHLRDHLGWLAVLAVFGLTGLWLACDSSPEFQIASDEPSGPRPDVTLPPVPDIDFNRVALYPDGSLSVWGLLQQREELLDEMVSVTAYIQSIYICEFREAMEAYDEAIMFREPPPEGFEEGTGAFVEGQRCQYPHLYIADGMEDETNILVTGYSASMERRLVVGERYTMSGRFIEETAGFNRAGTGLIYVMEITGGPLLPLEGEEGAEPPDDATRIR